MGFRRNSVFGHYSPSADFGKIQDSFRKEVTNTWNRKVIFKNFFSSIINYAIHKMRL